MTTIPPVAKVALGVLGGWLAIMAPAVVTIALRLQEFDSSGLPSTYAMILSIGWLTMMVALVASGVVGDAVRARTGSRVLLARVGVPLLAVGGVLLAVAPSAAWLLATWILVQIPSAMVVTTAMAETGDEVAQDRRGVASGLVGAAPIVALLVGSISVRFLAADLAWAFIVPAVIGALLAMPLCWANRGTGTVSVPTANDARHVTHVLAGLWFTFLGASFLLSWSTSTTNGFLVTFVQYGMRTAADQVADSTTLLVIIASSVAVISSVVAGRWSAGKPRAVALWIAAALICALALLLLVLVPSPLTLMIVALLFGIAFGAANGVELAVVLLIRRDPAILGRDLGIFTAATSAPYVLVPAMATLLLAENVRAGVMTLFALAGATALVAAVGLAVIAGRRRSQLRPAPEPLHAPG
jgi:MFS family permease